MANINATTPQLRVVKNLFDAYLTLDYKNSEQYVSKNFKFQTFPKTPDLPDETKEGHFERYGALLSLVTKVEYHFHEIIEAPGKVVLQTTAVGYTADGTKLEYDSVGIFTLAEEDGELKIIELKDFCNPEKRGKAHSWVAQNLTKGKPVA